MIGGKTAVEGGGGGWSARSSW